MIVEFIGVTGSGKSVIVSEAVASIKKQNVNVFLSYKYFLDAHKLGWIKKEKLSSMVIDILTFPRMICSIGRYYDLLIFASKVVFRDADSILYAINVLRNLSKRIVVFEFLKKRNKDDVVFIIDEGIIQQLHGVFVHIVNEPDKEEIDKFSNLINLPDLVVYVTSPRKKLIERIRYRGHQRVKLLSEINMNNFIEHALFAFSEILRKPRLSKILFKVENISLGPDELASCAQKVTDFILGGYRA